jgi:hypothetical protein
VNDQLLTIEQAAERYNCTVAAFRHKIRAKQIDPIFVLKDGRSYRSDRNSSPSRHPPT